MKFIKALLIIFSLTAIANCSSGGGGGSAAAPAPKSNAANDAVVIQYYGDLGVVTWSAQDVNIYMNSGQAGCVLGLSQGSTDDQIRSRMQQLASLINSSTIGKGTQPDADPSARVLNIDYDNGSTRFFVLDTELASIEEETLSRGPEIIEFFEQVDKDLSGGNGFIDCGSGKGDK